MNNALTWASEQRGIIIMCRLASIKTSRFLSWVGCLILAALNTTAFAQDQKIDFNINSQELAAALNAYGLQSDQEIFYLEAEIEGLVSGALRGSYDADTALKMLLDTTGIEYRVNKMGTVLIGTAAHDTQAGFHQVGLTTNAEYEANLSVYPWYEQADDFGGTVAEEVVTIGTRRNDRSVIQSSVPIDILQPGEIESTGFTDMNDALRTLVPAFNAKRLPLNDGASFVRPITLRSSPADHVLLLLNGKRRHRSSTVQLGTGHATTSGSQGQDFNFIPPIAMSNVEVLRDGASAQYGSDAIAGVINMILKSDSEGGTLAGQLGTALDGGGDEIDIQGNIGLPLTENGFLNLSFQYTNQNSTVRAGSHAGAQALTDAGYPDVPHPAVNLGDPDYEVIKLAWNAGLEFGENMRAYLIGNYMDSSSAIGLFYRQSVAAGGFPHHAVFVNSSYDDTPEHPEIFDLTELYPGGFTPRFAGDQKDFSTVMGVENELDNGLVLDFSLRWGENKVDYTISNTINASLGVQSPTSFKPGSLKQREYGINAGFSYEIENSVFASNVFLFGGISYRNEAYTIGAGDLASYALGPLLDLPVGSNGFQGFSPDTAGTFSAESYALFTELETDVSDNWTLSVAGRYEDYERFGGNFSYKLASHYQMTEGFALRGSLSTGFRAPASGQVFGTSQTSQIDSDSPTGFILDAVLIPGSEEAQIFGSTRLTSETSFSVSGGLVFEADSGFTITLDFYQLDVDNRLLLSDSIDATPAQQEQLTALGFPNGASIQQVRFFENKLDTRVRGFDLVSSYIVDWNGGQSTDIALAINYNKQILRVDSTGIFTPGKLAEFEQGIPRWNGNLSLNHHVGDFDLTVRGTYYGEWLRNNVLPPAPLHRDAVVIVDLHAVYHVTETIEVSASVRNLFDKYPPAREALFDNYGMIYDNHSVFGPGGAYYYLGATYRF